MKRPEGLSWASRAPQLASLRHRDFAHTWLSSMFTSAGLWSFIVATGWLVLVDSESSGWVGIVTFASMVPFLFVSPFGGLIGDVYDRRTVVLICLVAMTGVMTLMAVLAAMDALELWLIAVLALSAGVFRSLQEPVVTALVPNQVPREDLLNAMVLSGATRHGGRFFGPLVAGPLLAIDSVGVEGVLAVSAGFYALGAFEMSRTRTRSTGQTRPEAGILRNIADGLAYVYTHQAIALFMLLVAFHCALVMSFESILPVFSRAELGAEDGSIFAYLMMGFGAGSMAGLMIIAGMRSEKAKGQMLIATGVLSAITPMLLALSGSFPMAIGFAAAMGATQATFMALTVAYVQALAPDRLRSRISSLYTLHAGGIMAFANLAYGFMADAWSAPPILLTTGLLFLVVVVSLGIGQPVLRQVYRTGQVAAA